jgi:iron complex transport system substrate-binding protein
MKKFLGIIIIAILCVTCKHKNSSDIKNSKHKESIDIKYAKGFDVQYFKNYKKLIIKSPYQNSEEQFEYILRNSKKENITAVSGTIITTPIQKVVVTSTTHIPMLELLGVENSLIGFPHTKYISSPKTRKLIDANLVKEVGVKSSLNTEILLDLNPDVVIGFSMTKTSKSLNLIEKSGIPVVLNGDWLEDTPLGRAEWIKFFGVLYDKEKEADSIFNIIESNYNTAKKLANKADTKPTILSGAIMSKDIWNLPAGESFVAQFLTDANTSYLWKDSKGKGSLSISFESIIDRGKSADIWIAPGYFSSKKQMLEKNTNYKEFKAFKNNQLFTFANNVGETGGVLYFELGPTRPDLVLKDIIKITHPELLKDYTPTFFEKMN